MPIDPASELTVDAASTSGVTFMSADGSLDSSTYLALRDEILTAAVDSRAVIVDITALAISTPSALSVFTSARWHVSQWPNVPIALVCASGRVREIVQCSGITRRLPLYETTDEAVAALAVSRADTPARRSRMELPAVASSVSQSREMVSSWLSAWSMPQLSSVAKLVVTVLVENVLMHTTSAPIVRLECKDDRVTIAVEDGSSEPAVRRERCRRGPAEVSGLAIVAALCPEWGSLPTRSGKTVWATIGPENPLNRK